MFILPASPGMQPQGACADIFKLAQSSTIAFEFPDPMASVTSVAIAFSGFGVWRLERMLGWGSPARLCGSGWL